MSKEGVVTILISLIISTKAFCQGGNCKFDVDSLTQEIIYTSFDKPPRLGESDNDLLNYLLRNYKIPHHYSGNEMLLISFIVQTNGTLTNIRLVKKSENDLANKNFLELVESMPKWNPAYCNGNIVKAKYILPLRIRYNAKY